MRVPQCLHVRRCTWMSVHRVQRCQAPLDGANRWLGAAQGVWGTHMVLTMYGSQNPLQSVCWPCQSCWVIRHGKQAQMFGGNSGKESDVPSCLGCPVLGLCRRFTQASMFRNLTTQSVEECTVLTFISGSSFSFCISQSYQSETM